MTALVLLVIALIGTILVSRSLRGLGRRRLSIGGQGHYRGWLLAALTVLLVGVVGRVPAIVTADVPIYRHTPSGSSDPTAPWRAMNVNADGSPARWNPCTTMTWALNPSDTPYGSFVSDAVKAAAIIAKATDIDVRYVGETHVDPQQWRTEAASRSADVLVSWATDPSDLGLRFPDRHVAGIGGAVSVVRAGRITYVSGQVLLNPRAHLDPGFSSPGFGGVLLHEWGHVVGLAHVRKPTEVMDAASSVSRFGPGDRAGLRALGRKSGCLPTT